MKGDRKPKKSLIYRTRRHKALGALCGCASMPPATELNPSDQARDTGWPRSCRRQKMVAFRDKLNWDGNLILGQAALNSTHQIRPDTAAGQDPGNGKIF